MDVLDQKIGAEGGVKVTIGTGGVAAVDVTYAGAQAKANMHVEVSADALLAGLETHIESTFGKGAIELLRASLKAVPA